MWFLEWPGGYGVAGDLIASDGERVTRRFQALVGRPARGSAVDLGAYPFGGDPRAYRGLAFDDVNVRTRLGDMPAWFLTGSRDTWVLFVPGMAAGRGEPLRVIPAVAALGYPILAISYRNAPRAPPSRDRLYHLGTTEWEDLAAAIRYAHKHGARRVVLFGYSMGGSIVANLLNRSVLGRRVAGVVLDSPVLDWDAAVRLAASRRRVPGILTGVAERLVSARIGFDWNGPGGKVRADAFGMPVLLFHGSADVTVPIAGSVALAAALGERATLVATPDAGHIQSWNFDPEGYQRALGTWLERVAPDSL